MHRGAPEVPAAPHTDSTKDLLLQEAQRTRGTDVRATEGAGDRPGHTNGYIQCISTGPTRGRGRAHTAPLKVVRDIQCVATRHDYIVDLAARSCRIAHVEGIE